MGGGGGGWFGGGGILEWVGGGESVLGVADCGGGSRLSVWIWVGIERVGRTLTHGWGWTSGSDNFSTSFI